MQDRGSGIHFCLRRGLSAVAFLSLFLGVAGHAQQFTIGTLTPESAFSVQGQSFTPAVPGPAGSGTPRTSEGGTVALTSFKITFSPEDPAAPPGVLYIYDSLPSSEDAAEGRGSMGMGNIALRPQPLGLPSGLVRGNSVDSGVGTLKGPHSVSISRAK